MNKLGEKLMPPSLSLPSPNNVVFRSLKNEHCVCTIPTIVGGREGVGWAFMNLFEALFPRFLVFETFFKLGVAG